MRTPSLKYNIDLGGRGGGYTGGGGKHVHYANESVFVECLIIFVPHCSLDLTAYYIDFVSSTNRWNN